MLLLFTLKANKQTNKHTLASLLRSHHDGTGMNNTNAESSSSSPTSVMHTLDWDQQQDIKDAFCYDLPFTSFDDDDEEDDDNDDNDDAFDIMEEDEEADQHYHYHYRLHDDWCCCCLVLFSFLCVSFPYLFMSFLFVGMMITNEMQHKSMACITYHYWFGR